MHLMNSLRKLQRCILKSSAIKKLRKIFPGRDLSPGMPMLMTEQLSPNSFIFQPKLRQSGHCNDLVRAGLRTKLISLLQSVQTVAGALSLSFQPSRHPVRKLGTHGDIHHCNTRLSRCVDNLSTWTTLPLWYMPECRRFEARSGNFRIT
jgi:hypothetical protein